MLKIDVPAIYYSEPEIADMLHTTVSNVHEWMIAAAGDLSLTEKDIPENGIYTLQEVALILGISVRQVQRYIKNRELRGRKLGKQTLIKGSDLLAFFDNLPEADGNVNEDDGNDLD